MESPSLTIDPAALEQQLRGARLVTRFAPSPTGYLHLGHVVNAIYVWGIARALGGEVVLRLEDHDRHRSKPVYEAALLEDLEWLGLVPDRGLAAEFRAGPSDYRQSDCGARYAAAWESLRDADLGYVCDCSRRTIRDRTGQDPGEEIRYDGFCRERGLAPRPQTNWRVRLPGQKVEFGDLLQGRQVQTPAAQCGDVVLRDRKGNWSYQMAVVVDDLRHGVNVVVRGADILSSTGRQVLMAAALGQRLDVAWVHHGLLVDETGRKLSKRDFAVDIHARNRAGEDPRMVLGEAAWRVGLIQKWRPVAASELPGIVVPSHGAK